MGTPPCLLDKTDVERWICQEVEMLLVLQSATRDGHSPLDTWRGLPNPDTRTGNPQRLSGATYHVEQAGCAS